jgi:23S rRNA pseudouridine1911/1915/1917 synthase
MPDIIHEDNHIIVVIKPQNMPTCQDSSNDPDLLNELKQYIKTSGNKPGEAFCGLVHRLDRVTGGVMVFAKTSKAASRLTEQIQDGRMQKKYLAVVLNSPKDKTATLVDYLKKDESTNVVSIVGAAVTGAKRAELNYRTIHVLPQISLMEVDLLTGRSHQIRVQLQNIGCPIFGDTKYGGDKLAKGWNLALWAHELSFYHPTTNDLLRFKVNPPEDTPWNKFDFQRKKNTAPKG